MDKVAYQRIHSLQGLSFSNLLKNIKESFSSGSLTTKEGTVYVDEKGISVTSSSAKNIQPDTPKETPPSVDWFKILSIGIPVALFFFSKGRK